jgi:D-sedoheptulose 7-phosphate isomerase
MKHHLDTLTSRYPQLAVCRPDLSAAVNLLGEAFRGGGKLLVCGNGGSAADAEHIVGELMKGFLQPRRIPAEFADRLEASAGQLGTDIAAKLQGALPAVSLVSQLSLNTAVLNDTAADMIFAQQVYGLGKEGDVLLCISTSGNSANAINAAIVAKAKGVRTIVLTGRSGGKIAPHAEVAIRVPADTVVEIQELHLPVYHWLCIELEEQFFSRGAAV